MKSERRHELETNELADKLAQALETIRPYQNAILGAVLLIVVCSVAIGWWSKRAEAEKQQGWNTVYSILAEEPIQTAALDKLIESFAGTDLAHFATTSGADRILNQACNNLFVSKPAANDQLDTAATYYLQVLDQRSGTRKAALRAQATFGLARAREAQGNLDEARTRYEEVVKNWPDCAYSARAARRLKDIERPAVAKRYVDFAQFEPKPPTPPSDLPGTPGERPAFDPGSVPEDDGLFSPPALDLQNEPATPSTATPSTATPSTATPSTATPGTDEPVDPATATPIVMPPETPDPEPTPPVTTEPVTTDGETSVPGPAAPEPAETLPEAGE